MNRTFNDRVKNLVKKEENCHCTYRVITHESTAEAKDLITNEVRGYVFWDMYDDLCRVTLRVGELGIKHKTKFVASDSDEVINAKLRSTFIKMDNTWEN